VTSLWECPRCLLRFRSPKEDQKSNYEYYQEDYCEGSTTECPSDAQLSALIATRFRGSDCDFTRYLEIMQAVGLSGRNTVLDFGSSWGYGSWQMRDSGFDVWSYEIGRSRANYARDKLGCRVVKSLEELPAGLDCIFSAHVIEHLPDPALMWRVAKRVLREGGLIVCFCPNGNPELELRRGTHRYGYLWGKHHPMVITPQFMLGMCARTGFDAKVFSGPYGHRYQLEHTLRLTPDMAVHDEELCLVARRIRHPQE
jgi:SAM-dependent methyltransferase